MKRTSFVVSEKNFEPLFALFRSFREPIVVPDSAGEVSFTFDKCSNCLTVKAKANWDINANAAKAILEGRTGFELLPRERGVTSREYALLRAKELFGDGAYVQFSPKETDPKWKYRVYNAAGTQGGHGSDWDNALKVAVLAKTGWFFDSEVE